MSFRYVVHPVLTEEAEVTEESDSEAEPHEHANNARPTPPGRERTVGRSRTGQKIVTEAAGLCPRKVSQVG